MGGVREVPQQKSGGLRKFPVANRTRRNKLQRFTLASPAWMLQTPVCNVTATKKENALVTNEGICFQVSFLPRDPNTLFNPSLAYAGG